MSDLARGAREEQAERGQTKLPVGSSREDAVKACTRPMHWSMHPGCAPGWALAFKAGPVNSQVEGELKWRVLCFNWDEIR